MLWPLLGLRQLTCQLRLKQHNRRSKIGPGNSLQLQNPLQQQHLQHPLQQQQCQHLPFRENCLRYPRKLLQKRKFYKNFSKKKLKIRRCYDKEYLP
jgi:hypothetical protein